MNKTRSFADIRALYIWLSGLCWDQDSIAGWTWLHHWPLNLISEGFDYCLLDKNLDQRLPDSDNVLTGVVDEKDLHFFLTFVFKYEKQHDYYSFLS